MKRQYESYKESDVQWIGKIPTIWNVKRIKRFSQIKRGASPRPIHDIKYFDDSGEYSWVRISDVSASNKYLFHTTQTLSELGASLSVKQNPEDLFISIAGTVGKPIITKIKCCIHDGFIWFENPRFNKEFLYYIFLSEYPYKGLGKLGTQLNLNTDTIGQIFIPNPPKKEQKTIVLYLNQTCLSIDTIITTKQKQLKTLEALKKSIIHKAVTQGLDDSVKMKDSGVEWMGKIPKHWKAVKLKRIALLQSGLTLGKQYTGKLVKRSYLRVSNVQDGYLDLENVSTISLPLKTARGIELQKGDVLMTEGGDLDKLGRGFLWDGQIEKCLHQNHIFAIRPKNHKLSARFLTFITSSSYGRAYFEATGKKTTNLASTNASKIKAFYIPLPSVGEQKKIVSYLKSKTFQIEKLKKNIVKQIETLELYRKSIVHECVTGKRRITIDDLKEQ